jgi:hypothetical protein
MNRNYYVEEIPEPQPTIEPEIKEEKPILLLLNITNLQPNRKS